MAWRGSAGATSASAATTLAITVSGIGGSGPQNGDIVILSGTFGGSSSLTISCPGFSAVPGISNVALATSNNTFFALYKVAGGSEPASYTVSKGAGADFGAIQCNVFSGRNVSSPFTAATSVAATLHATPISIAVPTLTAAAGDDLLYLCGEGNNITSGGGVTFTLTVPSGYSNKLDTFSAVANVPGAHSCSQQAVAAGATGTVTGSVAWTGSAGSDDGAGYLISIAAAPILLSVVQTFNNQTPSGSTLTTTATAVTQNNTLAVMASWYLGSAGAFTPIPTCIDTTSGQTLQPLKTMAGDALGGGAELGAGIWFLPGELVAAGTHAIQISFANFSLVLTHGSLTVLEIAGPDGTKPADPAIASGLNWVSGGGLTASSGQPFTSTPSIALAAIAQRSSTGATNAGFACAGFTDASNQSNTTLGLGAEHCTQIFNGGATPSAAFTWTDSGTNGAQAVIGALSYAPILGQAFSYITTRGPGVSPVARNQFLGLRPFTTDVPKSFSGSQIASSTGFVSPANADPLVGISITMGTGTLIPFGISTVNAQGFIPSPGPGVGPFTNTQFLPKPFGYTSGANLPLVGTPMFSGTGFLSPSTTETLTGISITSTAGNVSGVTGGTVALSGQSFAATPGDLSNAAVLSVALNGTPLTLSQGTFFAGSGFRVQATAIGWYRGDMYDVGEVFDILSQNDFADSSIDYSSGGTGGPMFGWMKRVPGTTPLSNPTPQIYDWRSSRRTVF